MGADKTQGLDHHTRQILARIYLDAGRIDDALIIYERIINLYSLNRAYWPIWGVMTHFYLGRTDEEAGRNDEAVMQYENFLDIWRDADDDIEMIEDAKERLAKLKVG